VNRSYFERGRGKNLNFANLSRIKKFRFWLDFSCFGPLKVVIFDILNAGASFIKLIVAVVAKFKGDSNLVEKFQTVFDKLTESLLGLTRSDVDAFKVQGSVINFLMIDLYSTTLKMLVQWKVLNIPLLYEKSTDENCQPLPWYMDPKFKFELSLLTSSASMLINFGYSYFWSKALNEQFLDFCLNGATGRIGWIPKLNEFEQKKFPR